MSLQPSEKMNIIAFVLNLFAYTFMFSIVISIFSITIYVLTILVRKIKHFYIVINIKNISQVIFSERYVVYKKIYENTGYSVNLRTHGITQHYRKKTIPDGYERKTTICFQSGKRITTKLRETSLLYKKLRH